MDISKCETCQEDCPQAQGRREAATGRMYAMRELVKCAPYWDALFDENEKPNITPDRLRELVEADREGKCHIGRCVECAHYEGLAVCEFLGDCGGTNWICGWFEPKKAAEAALKGEQNESV